MPRDVWTDGRRLVALDTLNNRILIWQSFPTKSFQPADIVLGQGSFEANVANDDDQNGVTDTASARTMQPHATGIASNGVQLALADYANNRVLIWNSFPTRHFEPANTVLGQASFTATQRNDDDQDGRVDAAPSNRTLNRPTGLLFDRDKLLVLDCANNRLLVFISKR